MPEFVLIPAPVTTMTFLDFQSESSIVCSTRLEAGVTWTVGILAAYRYTMAP